MRDRDRSDDERRLRRAMLAAVTHQPAEPEDAEGDEADDAAANRIEQQALWVDLQVRQAMARGEFDNLPGAGKPIKDLGSTHDPDWWVKRLVEREKIAVLPPALALRKEDAELDSLLDRETTEEGVRGVLEDFNRRVVEARRQLQGGPPVVTPTRDLEREVLQWRARREDRRVRQRQELARLRAEAQVAPKRRWWRRRR